MEIFDLRKFIEISKECEDLDEVFSKYDGELAEQYLHRSYSNKFGVRYAWDQIYDTIWYYAKNPSIDTLLKLFRGTAKEFAEAYGLPLELVSIWESGEEAPPEYLITLLFSDMLNDGDGNYYLNPEYFDDSFLYEISDSDSNEEEFY